VAVHIAKKTQGKRNGTGKVSNDFDKEHNRGQPPDRSQKMFQVMKAVMLDANNVGRQEYNDSTGCRGINVGRRWVKTWNQADQVGYQNEDCQSRYQREKKNDHVHPWFQQSCFQRRQLPLP